MKIVAIVGNSPWHMDGSTGLLVNSMLQGAQAGGAKRRSFHCPTIPSSRARVVRHAVKRVCVRCGDDYEKVRDAALGADGLILASPVYMNHVSAQLKAFLDRSYSLSHRPDDGG